MTQQPRKPLSLKQAYGYAGLGLATAGGVAVIAVAAPVAAIVAACMVAPVVACEFAVTNKNGENKLTSNVKEAAVVIGSDIKTRFQNPPAL